MRTRGVIVGVVGIAMVAVSALTAMTTATAAEPAQVGRYSTIESAVAVPAMSQAVYLASVKQAGAGTTIAAQSDAAMIDSGKSLCADIAGGATRATFAKQVYDYGIDAAVFRDLLSASVMTFCPESAGIL